MTSASLLVRYLSMECPGFCPALVHAWDETRRTTIEASPVLALHAFLDDLDDLDDRDILQSTGRLRVGANGRDAGPTSYVIIIVREEKATP